METDRKTESFSTPNTDTFFQSRGCAMLAKKFILGSGTAVLTVLFLGIFLSASFAQTNSSMELSHTMRNHIQASGFVTAKPMPFWGTLSGTKEQVVNLSQGEICFVQMVPGKEVKPGDRLAIGRIGNKVIHPVTKTTLGWHVMFPGELVILEIKGSMATAKIEKSFQSIMLGDMVFPPQQTIPVSLSIRSSKKIEGFVVLGAEKEENITSNQVIFIDRGTQDGVIVGDRFSIYRIGYFPKEILEREKESLPLFKVGEAVAITVQEEVTTALVTSSSSFINVGFKAISGRE
jgi:hypothetical protein